MKKLLLIYFSIVFCSFNLLAQEIFEMKSTAVGFSGALHYGFTIWSSSDLDVDSEIGIHLGLKAGYGFSERIEAFLEYDLSIMFPEDEEFDAFPYKHIDIGARYNFGSTIKAFRYYAEISGMYQKSTQDAVDTDTWEYLTLKMRGYGLSIGGGAKYHIKLPIAIIIGGRYSFGTFDNILIDGYKYDYEFEANSFRIYMGIEYYF